MNPADDALGEVARAYEGLEDPASFPDRDALERYRAELLERSAPHADLIQNEVRTPARVLEVACGNGRLLVELSRRGALRSGYGNDIAASRIAFAQQWAQDAGADEVEFRAEDLEFVRTVLDRLGDRRHEAQMDEILAAVRADPPLTEGGLRG